jgi:pimeloyl-ACP methyl ester carboxylesterase
MRLTTLEQHRRTVPTRRGAISALDVGTDPAAGPVALFVHGVGTNAYLWRNVIAQIDGERRCVAIDLPTHGRSPGPVDDDTTLAGLADAVAAAVEALGLDAVDLVGHDTGGAVAQIFAARHSERLHSFTLTNCDTHDNVPPPAFQPTVDLARAGALAPTAPALFANLELTRTTIFGSGYEHVDQLDLDVVETFLEPLLGSPEGARAFEQLLARMDKADLLAVEPMLGQLTVPTLVVWGTGDEFFELRWAYWLRDTIPGVTEVVELDGAKLFFPDERAGELTPLLLRHWAAADRIGSTAR